VGLWAGYHTLQAYSNWLLVIPAFISQMGFISSSFDFRIDGTVRAVIAAVFLNAFPALSPFGLAFAAGVMVFITLDELIPVAHEHGHEHFTSLGVIIGCILTFGLLGAIS